MKILVGKYTFIHNLQTNESIIIFAETSFKEKAELPLTVKINEMEAEKKAAYAALWGNFNLSNGWKLKNIELKTIEEEDKP